MIKTLFKEGHKSLQDEAAIQEISWKSGNRGEGMSVTLSHHRVGSALR